MLIHRFVGFVRLEALQQEQNMHYVMIKPDSITAACRQRGTYVEPLTVACGSERVNVRQLSSLLWIISASNSQELCQIKLYFLERKKVSLPQVLILS